MPIDRRNYPDNWEAISFSIRFTRAHGRCECHGECGAHEGDEGGRDEYGRCLALHGQPHPVTASTVVLTTAHLDHDTSDNDPDNLMAMCQRCHLNYDKDYHARNAANTRRQQQIAAGQLELFGSKK